MAKDLREKKKASPRTRIAQVLMLLLVLLFLAGTWMTRMAHNYVYMFLDHYEGTTSVLAEMKGLRRTSEELEALLPLQQAFDDWKQTHLRDDVEITASDGAVLRGGLYDVGGDVTAVLLHSFDGSSAASDYLIAPYYAEKGWNILLPDSRAHGESEGSHVTYGMLEGYDTAAWVRWLLQRYGQDHRVILHGTDLGANAALAGAAVLGSEAGTRDAVLFAAAESPIDNLYDEAVFLLRSQYGLPAPMARLTDVYARNSLGGASMTEVSLETMTVGCTVPVLVICQTEDTVIDPASAGRFCGGYTGECTLLELPGRNGCGYALDPAGYEAALDAMFFAASGSGAGSAEDRP